jgi:hypothetical protein
MFLSLVFCRLVHRTLKDGTQPEGRGSVISIGENCGPRDVHVGLTYHSHSSTPELSPKGKVHSARIFGITDSRCGHIIQVALRYHCVASPPLQGRVQYLR